MMRDKIHILIIFTKTSQFLNRLHKFIFFQNALVITIVILDFFCKMHFKRGKYWQNDHSEPSFHRSLDGRKEVTGKMLLTGGMMVSSGKDIPMPGVVAFREFGSADVS